jgi:hypothetical protein
VYDVLFFCEFTCSELFLNYNSTYCTFSFSLAILVILSINYLPSPPVPHLFLICLAVLFRSPFLRLVTLTSFSRSILFPRLIHQGRQRKFSQNSNFILSILLSPFRKFRNIEIFVINLKSKLEYIPKKSVFCTPNRVELQSSFSSLVILVIVIFWQPSLLTFVQFCRFPAQCSTDFLSKILPASCPIFGGFPGEYSADFCLIFCRHFVQTLPASCPIFCRLPVQNSAGFLSNVLTSSCPIFCRLPVQYSAKSRHVFCRPPVRYSPCIMFGISLNSCPIFYRPPV